MARRDDSVVPSLGGGMTPVSGAAPCPVIVPPPVVKPPAMTGHQGEIVRRMAAELALRNRATTAIYTPMEHQLPFHQSQAQFRVVSGSNRAGKTLSATMECVWAVTGSHPFRKYPKSGVAFIVGRDQRHISQTLWPKLTEPIRSLMRIRDEVTGKWRQFHPQLDKGREAEAEQTEALLPDRLIDWKNSAWESKGERIISVLQLKNGWRLHFLTGKGDPAQGAEIDYGWFDEEVPDAWYKEIVARVIDRKGSFTWSATLQVGGDSLPALIEQCEAEAALPPEERVREHFAMTLAENLYMDEVQKQRFADAYRHDPDAYRVRVLGQPLKAGGLMYPQWSKTEHVIDPVLPPDDWCLYMVVDPGHTLCGVLFFAIPPEDHPQYGGHAILYDELYLRGCTPSDFAEAVYQKVKGRRFQAFIIDDCGSRRTDGAIGINMRQAYAQALEAKKVSSFETGHSFHTGISDRQTGFQMAREWLSSRISHKEHPTKPKLLVCSNCDNFQFEIKLYSKKRHPKAGWRDDPEDRNDHLMDSLRYAVMHGMPYQKPREKRVPLWKRLMRLDERRARQESTRIYVCAGSGGT